MEPPVVIGTSFPSTAESSVVTSIGSSLIVQLKITVFPNVLPSSPTSLTKAWTVKVCSPGSRVNSSIPLNGF